jgi:two-component system response regulator FixJ
MSQPTTVHLIDDDEAVLDALGLYLEAKGLTVHRHARAEPVAGAVFDARVPTCIVSDVRMPGMSGLDLQQALARRAADVPLILITAHGDIDLAVAAIKAGAHDFLEKPFDERRLLASIEAAVTAAATRRRSEHEVADLLARRAELSMRQQQVMDLAVKGRTNKEIGATLGISPRTVEIYRARVMERMGAGTLADLVRIALAIAGKG